MKQETSKKCRACSGPLRMHPQPPGDRGLWGRQEKPAGGSVSAQPGHLRGQHNSPDHLSTPCRCRACATWASVPPRTGDRAVHRRQGCAPLDPTESILNIGFQTRQISEEDTGPQRGKLIKAPAPSPDVPLLSKQTSLCFKMLAALGTRSLAMKKVDFTCRGGCCVPVPPSLSRAFEMGCRKELQRLCASGGPSWRSLLHTVPLHVPMAGPHAGPTACGPHQPFPGETGCPPQPVSHQCSSALPLAAGSLSRM